MQSKLRDSQIEGFGYGGYFFFFSFISCRVTNLLRTRQNLYFRVQILYKIVLAKWMIALNFDYFVQWHLDACFEVHYGPEAGFEPKSVV